MALNQVTSLITSIIEPNSSQYLLSLALNRSSVLHFKPASGLMSPLGTSPSHYSGLGINSTFGPTGIGSAYGSSPPISKPSSTKIDAGL